ncbi:MAG: endonuclease III [Christensenellales bacterium]
MEEEQRIRDILHILETVYYGEKSGLAFATPFELLIATMLSAQSTDKQVNKVTARLFLKANTPEGIIALGEAGLIQEIKSCGYFNEKAKNIMAASRMLIEKFDSKVPDTMEELILLPGVGRKTANVVLANAFGRDAIAVDTHVFRVSNRLGLAQAANVKQTELQLMEKIPKEKWSDAHHWLIWHGRRICSARKPKCGECPLSAVCKAQAGLAQNKT